MQEVFTDNNDYDLIEASRGISQVEANAIHKRHKQYAKRAANLTSRNSIDCLPAVQYEKILLERRLTEINDYLERIDNV